MRDGVDRPADGGCGDMEWFWFRGAGSGGDWFRGRLVPGAVGRMTEAGLAECTEASFSGRFRVVAVRRFRRFPRSTMVYLHARRFAPGRSAGLRVGFAAPGPTVASRWDRSQIGPDATGQTRRADATGRCGHPPRGWRIYGPQRHLHNGGLSGRPGCCENPVGRKRVFVGS
jgi:hypothetical protein